MKKGLYGLAGIICFVAGLKRFQRGEICAPSSFTMHVLRLKNGIGGGLDSAFRGETVTVLNHDPSLKEDAEDGKKIFVIAGRINYEWVPLWVGCPECDKESARSNHVLHKRRLV